jgi:hypothetical protein
MIGMPSFGAINVHRSTLCDVDRRGPRPTSRDFVPWRFSDAGCQSVWSDRRCPRPKPTGVIANLKYIARADISGFESSQPSHAVGSPRHKWAVSVGRQKVIIFIRAGGPRAKLRAPISGVSTNSCGCALRGVSLQARPARWAARCWHALAAAAIYGFADGASQPLDVLCIQDRKAELIGIFDACIHPRRTTMTCPPSVSISYGWQRVECDEITGT